MPSIARPIFWLSLCVALLSATDAGARTKKRVARRRQPPIAYYMADWIKGATREQAVARCRAQHLAERRKHPQWDLHDPRVCAARVVPVRGPYVRKPSKDPDDDTSVYVYRGPDGVWLDATGDNACFAAGTPVATPDGDRAIESMRPGDRLYAWDPGAGRVVVGEVIRAKRRADKPIGTLAFDDGTTIAATANHPFYAAAERAWVEAGKLAPGDRVLKLDGGRLREARLVSKTPFDRVADVFDLTVSPHHDFFAAGVLVHNY